jgi:hypothetical protein
MGIAVNHVAYNGEILKYARITMIAVDLASNQAAATVMGYKSKEDRQRSGDPYQLLVHSFELPTPHPENLLEHAYVVLAQQLPDLDWTEV